MSSKFKHNKKRNSGLAFELLTRKLGSQMVDHDTPGASQTLRIVKEYFGGPTPLAKERELFEVIVGTRGSSPHAAREILKEISSAAARTDGKVLDIKKSNLIKDVHHTFGKGFFDEFRIPTYRLLASVQLYLDGCRASGHQLSENVQKIQLEEGMVKYMTTTDPFGTGFTRESDIDGLVVTLAFEKFEEKYGSDLTGAQRELLETYSRSVMCDDLDMVAKKLFEEKGKLLKIFESSRRLKEVSGDTVTLQRFSEATEKLRSLNVTNVTDQTIEDMLLYCRLAEELKSNG